MKLAAGLAVVLLMCAPVTAQTTDAQAPNQYLKLQGFPQHGWIEIPADVLLDTPQMTVEAWVSVRDPHTPSLCSSIAGNGYTTGWWLGLCGTSMRSYFNGFNSVRTGGVIPEAWIHIATVTDGTTRKHYVNGVLVLEGAESPASSSTRAIRIGSDADWDFMPAGGIDDLRVWKVARTQEQIRRTMFASFIPESNDVTGMFQSLEAWYRFEGNAFDSWRTHHGTIMGTGIGFETGAAFTVPRRRSVAH